MILYLAVFVASAALSALLTPWVRRVAVGRGLVAPPASSRHLHTTPLPRLGGVAVCLAFLIAIAALVPISRLTDANFPVRELLGILLPALLVFLLGVYDDVRPLEAKSKMAVQSAAATLLYFGGFGVHLAGYFFSGFMATAIDLPLTVFWVLLITNAFNLIDGLDGLAAGSAVVSAIAIFAIALFTHNYLVAVMVIALAGAVLGFLPFNFYPARIFMGDSGSLFIGFLLSALALAGAQKTTSRLGIAIPVLIFGLPILDVTLAVVRRLLRRQSLFRGDADHIHHKLLKRGLSQPQAVLVLCAVSAAFGSVALVVMQRGHLLVLVLLALAVAIYAGVRQLHYAEFSRVSVNFPRSIQHRQIVADQANIRRATESLKSCADFRAICQVLQGTLQPIGFDGIRVKNLGKDGLPASVVHPLQYDPDGRLSFTWSERKRDDPSRHEYHFELVICSHPAWGHLSLFGLSDDEDFQLGLDILSEDFRTALSKAVARAIGGTKAMRPAPQNARAVPAGSSDSL